jgi:hypothetical protein
VLPTISLFRNSVLCCNILSNSVSFYHYLYRMYNCLSASITPQRHIEDSILLLFVNLYLTGVEEHQPPGELSLAQKLWFALNRRLGIPRSECRGGENRITHVPAHKCRKNTLSKVTGLSRSPLDFTYTPSHFIAIVLTVVSCPCFVKKCKNSVCHRPFYWGEISIYLSNNPFIYVMNE